VFQSLRLLWQEKGAADVFPISHAGEGCPFVLFSTTNRPPLEALERSAGSGAQGAQHDK
jgi:hypothetical protein